MYSVIPNRAQDQIFFLITGKSVSLKTKYKVKKGGFRLLQNMLSCPLQS